MLFTRATLLKLSIMLLEISAKLKITLLKKTTRH